MLATVFVLLLEQVESRWRCDSYDNRTKVAKYNQDHAVRKADLIQIDGAGHFEANEIILSFSLNSLAWWMGTSTDSITKARHAICDFYLREQRRNFKSLLQDQRSVVGLHIEFDETGQFCFSSILTQGSLFYELICQCKRIIESKLVIRYDPRCAKLWFAIVDVILSKSWLLDFINCFRKRGLFFSDRQGGTTALHFCEVVALHSILQDGKLLNR
ncbi:unnamed protein product [Symbiodinium microadriaticum]|nr:unnamed protein product [Symbiodinium microadriaticum]